LLSFFLSRGAIDEQKSKVFSGVFAIVWLGQAVVTLQIKLLGGNMYDHALLLSPRLLLICHSAFFQSVCIIGYTLFPLVIASFLSAIHLWGIIRIPVYIVLVAWSMAAGVSILGGSGVVRNRVVLAVYPLFIYYLALGCLCFVTP
jgi:protein YIPF6